MTKTFKTLALAAAAALSLPALAEYPDKPVTIVVPFAAGGPTDKVARDLAEALRKPLGGTIVIENVGGAGGTLGATKVAKAAADGYTLLLHHVGMATAPALYRSLQYKPLDDFEYLGMVNEVPMTLIGRPTLPAANYGELAKWIDANKGKINLANAGLGSASHLCGLLFQQAVAVDMTTVPYKGTAPAMTDLLGGQVDIMFDNLGSSLGHIKAGSLRALAVAGTARNENLPDVPTMVEAGFPGFISVAWFGVAAPARTPNDIVELISGHVARGLRRPEIREKLAGIGVDPVGGTPAEMTKFVQEEMARWGAVIQSANVKVD